MKQGREREKKERHKRRRLLTGERKLHEKSRKEMERHTVTGGRGAGGGDIL